MKKQMNFYKKNALRVIKNKDNLQAFLDVNKSDEEKENEIRVIEYNEYNFFELIKKANDGKTNKGKLLAEAHNRNIICLLPIIYTLIVMISALNGSHTRNPSLLRNITSVGLLILVQSLTIIIKNMVHFNLALLPIMYLFPLILIFIGVTILYKGINVFNYKRNRL